MVHKKRMHHETAEAASALGLKIASS